MNIRRACVPCRVRKVKCIPGPAQLCERCAMLGSDNCVYESIKKRGAGATLAMGEACTRCRIRKRRCDAERPCTRCVEANVASECEYENVGPHPMPSDQPQFLFWDGPDPPDSKARWTVGDTLPESSIEAQIATITLPALEAVPPALARAHSHSHDNLATSRASPEPQAHAINEAEACHQPPVILPPFSTLLPLASPAIPPEPHVTLISLGAEHFQLSDAALGELDLKFRLGVLCRMSKLGIKLTSERQQAVLHGDVSGTVINSFFIYAAQSLGMYFCDGISDSPTMVQLHAKHLQDALERLAEIFEGHDWELRAQAALWAITSSIMLSLDSFAFLYMEKGCDAINSGELGFISTHGRLPAFSEVLHEKFSVLSQIIYFENFLFLACDGAEPTMTTRIENEFRCRLAEVYPVLFRICPLTMRTNTVLLIKDAVVVLGHRPTDEAQVGTWRQSCDQQVAILFDYSQTLLSNLRRFTELGDNSGAEMIRRCCVNCFAHLAVLCEAIGEVETVPHAQVDEICDSSLERLSELAQDLRMEEYTRHDLLLWASWKKALKVLDVRLARVSLEHDAKLRRWKQIVEKVLLEFEAKLPAAGTPLLAKRVRQEDGRTEGSQYPNLILAPARRQYGI